MDETFDARLRHALHRRAGQMPATGGAVDGVLAEAHDRARRTQRRQRVAGALAVLLVLGVGTFAALQIFQPEEPEVVFAPGDDDGDDSPEEPAGGDDPAPDEDSQIEPGEPPAVNAACTGSEQGVDYRLRYPEDWWASDGTDAEACRWFHPEPFDMPDEPRDVPEIAIMVRVQDLAFDQMRELDPERTELLEEHETEIDGNRAVAQEYVSTFDAIYPEGTTFYRYLVDLDGRTLYGTTADAEVVQADYEESKRVLGAVMRSLDIVGGESTGEEPAAPACSAADDDSTPAAQEGLPLPVEERRHMIVEAAVACDYDRLAGLTADQFTYSFGVSDDFAGFLREREADGGEQAPLRYLTGMLDRPYGTIETEEETLYVWPSAFAYDSWDDVPAEDREALKPLYDEEDFAFFEQFGGYIGYRIGITAEGEWRFFVAGD